MKIIPETLLQRVKELRWTDVRKGVLAHRRLLLWMVGVILTLLILIRLFVGWYGERKLREITQEFSRTRGVEVSYDRFSVKGVAGVVLEELRVVPTPGDTLLKAGTIRIKLNLLPLLLFRVDVGSLTGSDIYLHFVKNEGYCNYDFLFREEPDAKEEVSSSSSVGYSRRVSRLFELLFRLLPSRVDLRNLTLSAVRNENQTTLHTSAIELKRGHVTSDWEITSEGLSQQVRMEGELNKGKKWLSGRLYSAHQGERVQVPYIDQAYEAGVSFRELAFELKADQTGRSSTHFGGSLIGNGLLIDYWRLCSDTIQTDRVGLEFQCKVGRDFVELDSASVLSLGEVRFHPYFRMAKKKEPVVSLGITGVSIDADAFRRSLVDFGFSSLRDLRVEGSFDYRASLEVNFARLDSLRLQAGVSNDRIKVLQAGGLTKMNAPFLYQAREPGRVEPLRTFVVGESHPGYRPLSSVPKVLQNAVLQSEDGSFYGHRGFLPEAMAQAIAHDIKVRRFARGGSTISMQLVKNVFLSRDKSLLRKLEEAVDVWLIENKRFTSKARMFEVYLNIIEWGPMVYGIGEASHFYFEKEPSELTLNEAIFLASIIPSPKTFAWSFDAQGQLRPEKFGHFRIVANRLFKTGIITEEEFAAFEPKVELKGRSYQLMSAIRMNRPEGEVLEEPLDEGNEPTLELLP